MPVAHPDTAADLALRIDPMVREDQVQHLRRGDPLYLLANAGLAVMVAVALRDSAPLPALLAWLAAIWLTTAWHGWMTWRQRGRSDQVDRHLRQVTWLSAVSGLLWAVGVLLVYPGADDIHRALLVVLLGGMATSAKFSLAVHLPALYALYVPMVAGLMLAALGSAGPARWVVLILTPLWLAGAVARARQMHAAMIESFRNRHTASLLAADLQAQKDVAVALGQSRSRFLAAASHDLRQPVHALSLFVSALQQRPPMDEAERLLGHVRNTVDGMGAMFNALLDVSRLDAEMVRPALGPVPLAPLLARIAADEGAIAAAKGLTLRCAVHGPADLAVHSDAQLLERVLRNLVSNAVRYTASGGVRLRADVRGGALRLRVADSGIGIPLAHRAEVFQEFVQLHNPERDRDQGLGLGLAIVQRLCALLAVPLRLRSRPGRGTVFTLMLPLAQGLAGQGTAATADRADQVGGLPALAPGDLVLVIDDAADIRVAMAALLRGWGCQVLTAPDLPALQPQLMALTTVPRLILCDLRLEGPDDGLAVIEQLRSGFNDEVPAILVTGDTGPERLQHAAASGLGLLHKPVSEAALRLAIGRALAATPADD
ncbi:hybrid sensor histidine kinase/response regulator [Ideonella sp. DXS22W]|uniref:histidine kinase n=1 Tax=Pseudaquabacterium inlustre TaxID=2984192 RepID=A0ABU9CGX4_9BURK